MSHAQRLDQLKLAIDKAGYSALIITNPMSIFYLTGYENADPGERLFALLVQAQGPSQIFLNRLFPQPDQHFNQDIQVHWHEDGQDVIQSMAQSLKEASKVGIDKDWRAHFVLSLIQALPAVTFDNGSPLVDGMRQVKSSQEQTLLIEASRLNDLAMEKLLSLVEQGLSEKEMVAALIDTYQELGCKGLAFEPIIAYGPNGADPHHMTDQTRPQRGQSVVLDIGSYYQGYASDMTRTVFYGQPDTESIKVYELVKAANLAAIAQVKPGVPYAAIDKAARDVIEAGGYGPYFTHRTGHNIGIECHEPGDVGLYNQDLVQVGHVFSIEPGIYLPGKLGVRIEDLVIVTEDGCQVLNQVSKDLMVIDPQ